MANAIAEVQVSWVSKSHKAVQDADTKVWYHCRTPIFEGIPTGTNVKLTLDDEGKVIGGEILGGPSVKPAKAVKQAAAPKSAPAPKLVTTQPTEAIETAPSTVCGYCGIERHNSHYSAKEIRTSCSTRQFLRDTAIVVDPANPQSIMQYGLWLAEAPRTVFASTVKGYEVIGGSSQPTPPADKAPKQAATLTAAPTATPATLKGGKAATAKADKAVASAVVKMTAESPAGVWDGLLVKHAKNTAGLFQFLTVQPMPGAKSHGNWIGATDSKIIAKIVKAEANDRVRVTLLDNAVVTDFAILGTAANETGLVRGIETSGKQAPAARRGQKADKVVKAGRTAKRAAARAESAADTAVAAANRVTSVTPLAPTATLKGTVKNTNTPAKAAKLVAADPKLAVLTDAQIDAKLANGGKKSRAAAAKQVKSTSKPVFNCSGTSQHRNTCFGRCLTN